MGILGKAKSRLTEQSPVFIEVKYKIDGIPYTEKVKGGMPQANSEIQDIRAACKKRKETFVLVSKTPKTK